jgi:hypothetical protein
MHHQYQMKPVANLQPFSSKLAADLNYTCRKFVTGINNTDGKFVTVTTGVGDTGGKLKLKLS